MLRTAKLFKTTILLIKGNKMVDETAIINALKLSYGEKIARWCQTPRTTTELRQMYEAEEHKAAHFIMVGGFGLEDYIQQLEKAGAIIYSSGKWQTTPEALEVLAKYFG